MFIFDLIDTIADEYRGWRRFKDEGGMLPFCSIFVACVGVPILFAIGIYLFIKALSTGSLPRIYGTLFVATPLLLGLWYLLRKCGREMDVQRGVRRGGMRDVLEEALR